MNVTQQQKRHRQKRLQIVFTNHKSTIDARPAFGDDVTMFDENITEIQKLALQQALGSKGKTQAKKQTRFEMAEVTLEVSAGVQLYAVHINDVDLEESVRVTRSQLIYGRDKEASTLAMTVLNQAKEVQPKMEGKFGLEAGVLEELELKIEDYELILEAPALAIDARSVATRSLEALFAENDEIIAKRLDRHIALIRRQHPEFAAEYDQARDLEEKRGTHSIEAAKKRGNLAAGDGAGDADARETDSISATAADPGREPESDEADLSLAL